MCEVDEYDAYNIVLDIEDIPYITSLPPSPENISPPITNPSSQTESSNETTKFRRNSASTDEFSEYNFSEFTAEDFASIDAHVASSFVHYNEPKRSFSSGSSKDALHQAPTSDTVVDNIFGGPALGIGIEGSTDYCGLVKASEDVLAPLTPYQSSIQPQKKRQKNLSPYSMFRTFSGSLGVTDLTGPAWCEVQFDYGLRQKRSAKLEKRPEAFVTPKGKIISVDKKVAASNDQRLTRGKIVHKILEREIRPKEVKVDVTFPEERWALRLVNMIDCMQSLLDIGRCREMPVFGIIQDQLVTGIIDEINRRPILEAPPEFEPESVSGIRRTRKRNSDARSAPPTPNKSRSKRGRRSPSPESSSQSQQSQITEYFSASSQIPEESDTNAAQVMMDVQLQTAPATPISGQPISLPPLPSHSSLPPSPDISSPLRFRLHISDTKTRSKGYLPPDADTFPSQLQLMIYHKLLSALLRNPSRSEDALDFHLLWTRLGLDSTRSLSDRFKIQAGLIDSSRAVDSSNTSLNSLDDLTRAWRNTVEMLNIDGVDNNLTLVYRTRNQKEKKNRKDKNMDHATAGTRATELISKDEEDDIARAVMASLKDGSQGADDEQLSQIVAQSVHQIAVDTMDVEGVASSSKNGQASVASDPLNQDPDLAWVIQQSLLEHMKHHPELKEAAVPSTPTNEETEGNSGTVTPELRVNIIGTKTVTMDESLTDSFVRSSLDYWYGRRPPRGVDIELTRRCSSCEYRDGCEWREMKAAEARNKIQMKKTLHPES